MDQLENVRASTEMVYDLQKLRIATSNRMEAFGPANKPILPKEDIQFLKKQASVLADLEKEAQRFVEKKVKGVPVYDKWLVNQIGCGRMMSAILISSIDIHKAESVSKIWAYAGLDVMKNGEGRRNVKGQRSRYNPWLKAKLMGVLADLFVRSAVWDTDEQCYVRKERIFEKDENGKKRVKLDEDGNEMTRIVKRFDRDEVWRRFYDDYKHRKQNQLVDTCAACEGRKIVLTDKDKRKEFDSSSEAQQAKLVKASSPCANCSGSGGPAPWGRSDAHRAQAAKRYMIKMFLKELYVQWRTLEGLPLRKPYAEEYLGRKHHA